MWAALASAIIAIAASFGAQHVIDRVQRIKLRSKGMSGDQIISQLMTVVKQAETKYNGFYNKLAGKLQSMPNADILLSGRAADAIRDRRHEIEESMNDVAEKVSKLEPIQQRITTYATQPESYRSSLAGREDFASLKRNVEDTLKE